MFSIYKNGKNFNWWVIDIVFCGLDVVRVFILFIGFGGSGGYFSLVGL